MLLEGAIKAQGKVGLMMNVKKKDLKKVLKVLPALQKPTVSELSDKAWVDINTIIDEKTVKEIIPKLKEAWGRQYKEGYEARISGNPRSTHHARRRGSWFRGWDDADKKLKGKENDG